MAARTQSEIGSSNSKKGKTNERRISNILSKWSNLEFRRRKIEGRDTKTIAIDSTSDIICASKQINYSIESKNIVLCSINSLLISPEKSQFTNWWAQCYYDCVILSKCKNTVIKPMLFFKPYKNDDWVAIDSDNFKSLMINIPSLQFSIYNENPIKYKYSFSKKNNQTIDLILPNPTIFRFKDMLKLDSKIFF